MPARAALSGSSCNFYSRQKMQRIVNQITKQFINTNNHIGTQLHSPAGHQGGIRVMKLENRTCCE